MALNINASNYINTQTAGTNNGQTVSGAVSVNSDGAVISVKGLDLQAGQTISGQVVDIDGKDIKLLLSNNQTINAHLEGNINALLGQTLSFEVKSSENGQTSLRPLYTNLDNSGTVSLALKSAGLPATEGYVKMVSSMMDESMPINKDAIYDMSKQINTFPNANPETIVKLTKLGLQVNELTINQYENYKGFEYQIKDNVNTISKEIADLIKDSLAETVKDNGITDITPEKTLNSNLQAATETVKAGGKSLLTAFLNAINGTASDFNVDKTTEESEVTENKDLSVQDDTKATESVAVPTDNNGTGTTLKTIDAETFNTARIVLDMVDENEASDSVISKDMKEFFREFSKIVDDNNILNNSLEIENAESNVKSVRDDVINAVMKQAQDTIDDSALKSSVSALDDNIYTETEGKEVLKLAKDILAEMADSPEKIPQEVKEKLTKLLSSKEFGSLVKDTLSKQILLKPEEVVNSKNIEELYSKITKQANQAVELLQTLSKENPEVLNAAKNIIDNVEFMNELNQVATYVQLPLLMNNRSAHGDLYVYTKKKSLKDNDGDISALLHLDMENLGPMDVYIQLINKSNLKTHFYMKDEETIDFIEAHIDALNKRLTEKGYNMDLNVSVKDKSKGRTNIADEMLKNDPLEEGISASKFSFDVRA